MEQATHSISFIINIKHVKTVKTFSTNQKHFYLGNGFWSHFDPAALKHVISTLVRGQGHRS